MSKREKGKRVKMNEKKDKDFVATPLDGEVDVSGTQAVPVSTLKPRKSQKRNKPSKRGKTTKAKGRKEDGVLIQPVSELGGGVTSPQPQKEEEKSG